MSEQTTTPQPCPTCNGAGTITITDFDNGVMTSRSHTCNTCAGTGRWYQ